MIHLYNEALLGDFTIYPLLVLILLSQSILLVNSCINRRTLTSNVLNEYYVISSNPFPLVCSYLAHVPSHFKPFHMRIGQETQMLANRLVPIVY